MVAARTENLSGAVINRGIFAATTIPEGWIDHHRSDAESRNLIRALHIVEPHCVLLGVIPRSSNSHTFLIRVDGQVRICQFGPDFSMRQDGGFVGERLNPNKFTEATSRLQHVHKYGGAVPRVFKSGMIQEHGIHRSFIEMELLKGVPGDRFLANHPERSEEIFFKVGKELGRLSSIPLPDHLRTDDLKNNLLTRQQRVLEELVIKKHLTSQEANLILEVTFVRLQQLPDLLPTFVHKDPFPVNWHIAGLQSQLTIHFTDIEAIDVGHPWLEGIVRAGQWAGSDWFAINGTSQQAQVIDALVDGFNTVVPADLQLDKEQFADLAQTEELLWLPLAMFFSSLKGESAGMERRRQALMAMASSTL